MVRCDICSKRTIGEMANMNDMNHPHAFDHIFRPVKLLRLSSNMGMEMCFITVIRRYTWEARFLLLLLPLLLLFVRLDDVLAVDRAVTAVRRQAKSRRTTR